MEISLDEANKVAPADRILEDHYPPRVKQRSLAILCAYREEMEEKTKGRFKLGYKWNRVCGDINQVCRETLGNKFIVGFLKPQNLQSFVKTGGGISSRKFEYIDLFIRKLELDEEYDSIRARVRRNMVYSYATFLSEYYFSRKSLIDTLNEREDCLIPSFPWYFQSKIYINRPPLFEGLQFRFQVFCRINCSLDGCLNFQIVRVPNPFDPNELPGHFDSAVPLSHQFPDYLLAYSGLLVIQDPFPTCGLDLRLAVPDQSESTPGFLMEPEEQPTIENTNAGPSSTGALNHISGTAKARSFNCERSNFGVLDSPYRLYLSMPDEQTRISFPKFLSFALSHSLHYGVEWEPEPFQWTDENRTILDLYTLPDSGDLAAARRKKFDSLFSTVFGDNVI